MGLKGGGGLNGQPAFPQFHVNRPKKVGTVQRKVSRKTAMGLKGGILWTARVPPLSCEQAQNSGVSVKKSEQKNSDGVEGGGGGGGAGREMMLFPPLPLFCLFSPICISRLSPLSE